jgi:hypothetical protein
MSALKYLRYVKVVPALNNRSMKTYWEMDVSSCIFNFGIRCSLVLSFTLQLFLPPKKKPLTPGWYEAGLASEAV